MRYGGLSNQLRVTFVISSLSYGGAQTSILTLLSALRSSGATVRLITFAPGGTRQSAHLLSNIDFHIETIGAKVRHLPGLFEYPRMLLRLRSKLQSPPADVIIAFLDKAYIATLLAMVGSRVSVIISERVSPSLLPLNLFWKVLRRLLLWRAAAAVVVSEHAASEMRTQFRKPIFVIPGPIDTSGYLVGDSLKRGKVILGMGRLVPQKGFDLLIKAFAAVAPEFPDWNLKIIGEGPLEPVLTSLAAMCGVASRFSICPPTPSPSEEFQSAGIFVLSSRFEGFPRVLAEAMLCGCPCIGFDCPGAVRDMIRNGHNGLLVPHKDMNALPHALRTLLSDEVLRKTLSENAPSIASISGLETTIPAWRKVIESVL